MQYSVKQSIIDYNITQFTTWRMPEFIMPEYMILVQEGVPEVQHNMFSFQECKAGRCVPCAVIGPWSLKKKHQNVKQCESRFIVRGREVSCV